MPSCNISVLFYKQDFQQHTCILGHQAKKGNMDTRKRTCKKTLSLPFFALKKNHNKVGISSTPKLWFSFLCCHRFPQHSLGKGGRNHRTFTQICLRELFHSHAETCPVHPPFWNCQSSEALSIFLSTSSRLHQPSPSISSQFLVLVSWPKHLPKQAESSQYYEECK